MLQTVVGPAGHELCLPEMALEEHVAHYRTKVDDAVREYAAASQELRRLVRYLTLPPIPMVNVGNAVKDREQRLLAVFRMLETPVPLQNSPQVAVTCGLAGRSKLRQDRGSWLFVCST